MATGFNVIRCVGTRAQRINNEKRRWNGCIARWPLPNNSERGGDGSEKYYMALPQGTGTHRVRTRYA